MIQEKKAMIALRDERQAIEYEHLQNEIDIVKVRLREERIETLGILCENSITMILYILAALQEKIPVVLFKTEFKIEKVNTKCVEYEIDGLLHNNKLIKRNCKKNNKMYSGTAVVLFTTGSSGEEKGVALSLENILFSAKSAINEFAYLENEKILIYRSIVHSFPFTCELIAGLLSKAEIVIENTLLRVPRSINKYKITLMTGIPIFFINIFIGMKEITDLKKIILGGTTIFKNAIELITELFSGEVICAYGLTETAPLVTYYRVKDYFSNPMPIGRPFNNIKVKLIDEKGCMIEQIGQKGQIVVSGPNVMLGYVESKKKQDLDLMTGDIGYYNENGDLVFFERQDRIISINGYKKALNYYEEDIQRNLNLKSIAIIEKSDLLGAYRLEVFLEETDKGKEQKIKEYFGKKEIRVESFNYLVEIPKMSNGKINYQELRHKK